jgi:ABC-type ATPase involved in cell division
MPRVDVVAEVELPDSFRVQQVAGMFDVPLAEKLSESFSVEVPATDEDWNIGLIVGPSGSGKSTVARHVYASELYRVARWPKDKAIVDAFPDKLDAKQIVQTLTAVGFSSPPAWLKPYRVLSGGEQFRCDLARALLADSPLVVFDEFTSVVDRNVAKIGSAAIAKSIRAGHINRKFVAVTCHYDVVEWLEPDWVLDMASGELARRRLRRPEIELQICRGTSKAWPLFARHHYLSGNLAPAARCYYGVIEGQLCGLCAFLPLLGRKANRRVTRIVVLPDYQGVGVGGHLLAGACSLVAAEGNRVTITTSHPAMIAHLKRSPRWRVTRVLKGGGAKPGWHNSSGKTQYVSSHGRAVISAEFLPTS